MSVDVRTIQDMNGLIAYFAQTLNWRIDLDDFEDIEDIAYDFEAEDIGLKEEAFAKIKSLRQLPPLVDSQKWGIFCVEFDSRKFEVTALRKILSGLIPKRRRSPDHAVWDQKDLLFLCFWGSDNDRTIGIAHFEDPGSGLPQIKMISCAPAMEDFIQIRNFEDKLKSLKWPMNYVDHDKWRDDWSSAFVTGYRQTIRDAATLTAQLAAEAQGIRNRILEILEVESANGYVHLLYDKFKNTLIHDMTEKQFADMYAQTVVYGLFSARCMDDTQETFSAAEAVDCIPNTNPFLKSLMRECLGSQSRSVLSFDELEIGNVVDLLKHTKTDAIIADFNRQTGGGKEDPVIHFYEEFLTAYDKAQKVQRGVYYTPQPVVNFIVRAVDTIIKKDFGMEDGLASTATKTIKVMRQSKRKVGDYYKQVEDTEEVPAVQVLDPSTGTGTFIRQTILQIYENFKEMNKGLSADALKKAWNEYVPAHLLPRINAFELMMAPYAVAHMKLAMVLKDTGYEFKSDKRLNVYLTNSLEEPGDSSDQFSLWSDPLAAESVEANKVKKNTGIDIVIGNPPYSGESANKNDYILSLMDDYKKEPGKAIRLQEQNSKWINDDYVKFIRYAQSIIENSTQGILAFINPHGFIDNPTFRGMRWALLSAFSEIYILDLHGNAKKREVSPDGTKDENVFDIQQGVCIFIGIRGKGKKCQVFHADLYGSRERKYSVLNDIAFEDISWTEVTPAAENYLFIEQNTELTKKWDTFFKLEEVFPVNGVGICSKRDPIAFHDCKEDLVEVLNDFTILSEDAIKKKYNVTSESRDQKVVYAKENIIKYGIKEEYIKQCLYRPFDLKWTYYTDKVRGFLAYPVFKVLSNMLYDNVGLIVSRQGQASDLANWNVVFATDKIVDLNIFRRGGGCLFPLYIYSREFGRTVRKPNLNKTIVHDFSSRLGLRLSEEALVDRDKYYTPEDFWNYIYAVLHSPVYRRTFKEFLNLDFPRIPFIDDIEKFWKLVDLGNALKNVHLMKDTEVVSLCEATLSDGSNVIEKLTYKDNAVYINKQQCFTPIPQPVWDFQIGGYQPLEKWLKDRKGTVISESDINLYKFIVGAIEKTLDLMATVDSVMGQL